MKIIVWQGFYNVAAGNTILQYEKYTRTEVSGYKC